MEDTVFLFVRHGESIKNQRNVTGGRGESLTSYGKQQCLDLAQQLSQKIDCTDARIITSTAVQAIQTAEILSVKMGIHYRITNRLGPADMGVVSGLTPAEISSLYPKAAESLQLWRNREIEACELEVPGMEKPELFWKRITSYFTELCVGGTVIVVCTRSIFVLAYNLMQNHTPEPCGGYRHVNVDQCSTMAFKMSSDGNVLSNIPELTSVELL